MGSTLARKNQTYQTPRRQGSLVLETLIALVLLSLVLALAAKTSAVMQRHRQRMQWQHITLAAKTNLMTYAMAVPYEQLSTESLLALAPKSLDQQPLTWQIEVQELPIQVSATPANAKRVSVGLKTPASSAAKSGGPALVAWRYPVDVATAEASP